MKPSKPDPRQLDLEAAIDEHPVAHVAQEFSSGKSHVDPSVGHHPIINTLLHMAEARA